MTTVQIQLPDELAQDAQAAGLLTPEAMAANSRRLFDWAIDDTVSLYSSPALIEELAHTLAYPKLARRLAALDTTPDAPSSRAIAPWPPKPASSSRATSICTAWAATTTASPSSPPRPGRPANRTIGQPLNTSGQ